jgi:hypothetical protein
MPKDRTEVMETGDGITRREFQSKQSAGNVALARIRGRSYVEKLLLA